MNTPLWISSCLVLDARRAVWLPKEATLAAADLCLGSPLSPPPAKKGGKTPSKTAKSAKAAVPPTPEQSAMLDAAADVLGITDEEMQPASAQEAVARLLSLCAEYQPKQVVLMGQLIHPDADREALIPLLKALFEALRERAALVLVGDDLNPALDALLQKCDWHAGVVPIWNCGEIALTHSGVAPETLMEAQEEGKQIVLGFENPAVSLRRSSAKYPCFVLGSKMTLLPAFSTELPGNDLWESPHLASLMNRTAFDYTVAIRKGVLIPAKLGRRARREK